MWPSPTALAICRGAPVQSPAAKTPSTLVTMALSTAKVKVSALSARSTQDGNALINVVLEVKNREELSSVINRLHQIPGVYQVDRNSGN